tara:strand:- start:836 stop:1303 length:468 start_codon:yes stop_codon:yes gene_type:complete
MKNYKTTYYTGWQSISDELGEILNELLQRQIDDFQGRLTKWYEENDVEVYIWYTSTMTSLGDGFHNILDYSNHDDDAHKVPWSEVFDIDGALDIIFDVFNDWGLKYEPDHYQYHLDHKEPLPSVLQSDAYSQMNEKLRDWLDFRGIPDSYDVWAN